LTFERRLASAFRMDEAIWRRHANPWSVWSRFTTLPLLVLAAWSRVWLGWWALAPVAAALLWTWLNPRIFPPPASLDSWAARGVMGERCWLNRDVSPVPAHHRVAPHVLAAVSAAGLAVTVWGVVALDPWPSVAGVTVSIMGKLWFVDRMAWLYLDMQGRAEPDL